MKKKNAARRANLKLQYDYESSHSLLFPLSEKKKRNLKINISKPIVIISYQNVCINGETSLFSSSPSSILYHPFLPLPKTMTQKLTPMMERYLEVKAQNPGTILLFRMGDFYELFYEDAKVAAKILGLTLTSRDKNSDNPVPMAGFPYHALDNYLQKLIQAGCRAAICAGRRRLAMGPLPSLDFR